MFRKLLADRLKCSEDELVDRGYRVVSAGVAAGPGSRLRLICEGEGAQAALDDLVALVDSGFGEPLV